MHISGFAIVLTLTALGGGAAAQIMPPPPTATLIDFDDLTDAPTDIFAGTVTPLSTEYTARGVTFAGFGQSGGGVFHLTEAEFAIPGVSEPNSLVFASAFATGTGGLLQTPETLTFYPPIQSLQFNANTLAIDCEGTMVLNVESFAPGGASLGTSMTLLPAPVSAGGAGGVTLSFTYPASGAERVVITSSHSCGPPGSLFFGVELFSIDDLAFVSIAAPASKCARSQAKAARDYAKALAACQAKAVSSGEAVDDECLARAASKFDKAFAKAAKPGDCLTAADAATTAGSVDALLSQLIQTATGGAPGPDICGGQKLKAAGKKTADVVKCYADAAKEGATADPACVTKAGDAFNRALKKCGTPEQLAPLEDLIDTFATDLFRALTVPTTTTTTTTTTSTTTTTVPPLGQHLAFTTAAGTANCTLPADPPFSGTLYADTAATMPIQDLGLGCLYIGGGAAAVPPSATPENATSILDSPDGMTLVASFGTGQRDCSRGPQATRHCVQFPATECTTDADCGGVIGACQGDANCYFGPPVPINGFPPNCVVNTFASDASGTVDLATGSSSVSIELASRVYLTLGQPSSCPQCIDGACNYGANAGGACTTANSALTTVDCLPSAGLFLATIPVDLTPLTTGTSLVTAADGNFCSPQTTPGAFGEPTTQAIEQVGVPAGDLTDGLPHASTLVSNFCIPATGNGAVDGLANLPGPGSLSLPGTAQFVTP